MKRTEKTLLMIFVISLFSCHDETFETKLHNDEKTESTHHISNEMLIYKNQTDKVQILNNLIRYKSGGFYLDLSKQDAEDIGVPHSVYQQIIEQINQLNNNIK